MKISPQLAASSLLGALAYLGLAIWGLGGFAAFFGHPQLTLIALATLLMVVASLSSEVNLSSGVREDQGNRWVLPVFGVIGLLSGFVPAYSDRMDFCTFGGEGLRWLGAGAAVGGADPDPADRADSCRGSLAAQPFRPGVQRLLRPQLAPAARGLLRFCKKNQTPLATVMHRSSTHLSPRAKDARQGTGAFYPLTLAGGFLQY